MTEKGAKNFFIKACTFKFMKKMLSQNRLWFCICFLVNVNGELEVTREYTLKNVHLCCKIV